jgi:hypothetical protein
MVRALALVLPVVVCHFLGTAWAQSAVPPSPAVPPTVTGAPAPAPAPPPSAARPEEPEPPELSLRISRRPQTVDEVAAAQRQELRIGGRRLRYSLNFFAEALAGVNSNPPDNGKLAFGLGNFDVVITAELAPEITAIVELNFEVSTEGATTPDLERVILRYATPRWGIQMGRTHLQVGVWNNAYHHGGFVQPTIQRPRWMRFEDDEGILPIHLVGVESWANFSLPVGAMMALLAVGNGRGTVVDDIQTNKDANHAKSVLLRLEYATPGSDPTRMGIVGIYDRIAGANARLRPLFPNQPLNEVILNAFVARLGSPWLFVAELYAVLHPVANNTFATLGGFGVVGYNIQRFTPYLQFEAVRAVGGVDPYFNNADVQLEPSIGGIAGVRFDLSSWTALKLEYRVEHRQLTNHGGAFSWSFGI